MDHVTVDVVKEFIYLSSNQCSDDYSHPDLLQEAEIT